MELGSTGGERPTQSHAARESGPTEPDRLRARPERLAPQAAGASPAVAKSAVADISAVAM
ncbi:hypothetical protein ACWGKQ_19140 [Streptomyces sp. NPDC054770]